MTLEKKRISFNTKIPELHYLYANANLNEESFFQEKRHFELLIVQAVTSCDYKRVRFLIRKTFSRMQTDSFDNLLLIYYTVAIITLLTRVVIVEGVCEKEAYSLSDAYLGLNFKELKVQPIQFIDEIVENFMILIENTKFYKYDSQLVNKIINYIKNNVDNDLKVIHIANHFHLSPEYLSYQFKSVTGMSLKSFINQEKIEFSKYLLTSTDLTIIEITMMLAYTDQSYFSKVFKKYTKMSPSQYRKSGIVKFKSKDKY
ncbi:TPA: helix-turn-helix transcriptional regulator [Enterococcus faecium]|uniref:helix-turn-helix domain-containing protein n=1 Tax=Enterococcus faecium TaxID=1352 RepID=UPI0002A369EC|nr:AraC family transcriptional regulator [Enterococcus faecium]VTQ71299.1 AraC family response regulator [Enterococcus hirae]ELA81951.1 hypothetical protein OI1_06252 [Enterococcus faecium EnGen0016]EZP88562.1 hypothetical protein Z973_15735 [Enterococcus faecium VRE1044]MCZ2036682.1 AraC family transcriptional regulator [Enterococcus faecium]MCZ2254613.1 AraC family transcriptional regulator [Enterococcus faecium]